MLQLRSLLLPAAAAAALAAPGAAEAATFCVGPVVCDGGTPAASLQAALDAAAVNGAEDTVRLGAGTYTGTFGYQSAERVHLTGAGAGSTILAPGSGSVTLGVIGSSASTVEDLTVRVKDTSGGRGVLTDGIVRDVEVVHEGSEFDVAGIRLLDGGTVERAAVDVDGRDAVERIGTTGSAVVRDSTLTAGGTGVHTSAGLGVQIHRSRITSARSGLFLAGPATLSDLLVTTTSTIFGDAALNAVSGASVVAAHLTLQGAGAAKGIAVDATAAPAAVTVRSSSIAGFQFDVARYGSAAHAANLTLTHSRYATQYTNGQTGTLDGATGRITAEPQYADAGAGNFVPAPGSPLVDAGDPLNVVAADLDGAGRPADGDGDGVARPDVGALELVPPPPSEPDPPQEPDPEQPPAEPGTPQQPPAAPTAPGAGASDPPPVTPPVLTTPRSTPPVISDRTRPVLSRLRRRGRILTFRLSEAATVTVRVERRAGGRWVRVATRRVRARRGTTRVRIPRGTGLRLRLVAVDRAGNRSGTRTLR